MGFQSNIVTAVGAVTGATVGISKALKQRQEAAIKKAKEEFDAKREQKQNYRKPKGLMALYGGKNEEK